MAELFRLESAGSESNGSWAKRCEKKIMFGCFSVLRQDDLGQTWIVKNQMFSRIFESIELSDFNRFLNVFTPLKKTQKAVFQCRWKSSRRTKSSTLIRWCAPLRCIRRGTPVKHGLAMW